MWVTDSGAANLKVPTESLCEFVEHHRHSLGKVLPRGEPFRKRSVAGTYRMMGKWLRLRGDIYQNTWVHHDFVLQHTLFLKCWVIFWEGFFTKPPLPDATIIQQESQNHPYRMTACANGEWEKSTNRPNHCHRQLQLSNAFTLQPTRIAAFSIVYCLIFFVDCLTTKR